MLELNELQRLADASIKDGDWFPSDFGQGHLLREDAAYIAAMSPDTAKKLIAVALAADNHCAAKQAAEVLSESVDVEPFFRANDRANEAFAALRTALEELKGKT